MKKLLLGIGIGALVMVPVSALAFASTPWTNNIYNVSDEEGSNPTVSVFDDADNKCYVVRSYIDGIMSAAIPVAISCVKR